jgi:hypothetical protein
MFLVRSQRGSSIVDELAGVELGLGFLTMGSTCKKTINENLLRKSDIYRKNLFFSFLPQMKNFRVLVFAA